MSATRDSRSEQGQEPKETERFSKRSAIAVGIVALVGLLLVLLWYASTILLLLFAGVLVAVFLRSVADWISRLTRLPTGWSLVVVVMLIVGIIALVAVLAAPGIADQVDQLTQQLPQAWDKLRARFDRYTWTRHLLNATPEPQQLLSTTQPGALKQARGFVTQTIHVKVGIVVVIAVGLYLAADPEQYRRGVLHLVPIRHRGRAMEVLDAIGQTLRGWLLGQAVSMLIVSVVTCAGLWLIGIPLWFVLGLLAGVLEFVPYVGPFVGFLVPMLLAMAMGPTHALWVAALYLFVQLSESYLITPLVQQRAVQVPPVLTIAGQMIMAVLAGALGVLLATPLLAVVLVCVKMLYVEDVVGDEVDTPDDHAQGRRKSSQRA